MIVLAIVLFMLSVLAMLPPFIVLVGQFPGPPSNQLEKFISEYDGTIVSLGTVFLVSGLALLTTYLSSASAEKRDQAARHLNAELKLSTFRQEWINSLRSDLSEVVALAYVFFDDESGTQAKEDKSKLADLKRVEARIRMRLNPTEDEATELVGHLVDMINACDKNDQENSITHREALANAGSIYIKNEWDTLKENLENLKKADVQ